MGGKPARATDSRFRTTGVQATAQETRSAGGISAAQDCPPASCMLGYALRVIFSSLCSKATTRLPLRLGSTQTPPWDESPRAPPTVARITDPNWEGVQATAEENALRRRHLCCAGLPTCFMHAPLRFRVLSSCASCACLRMLGADRRFDSGLWRGGRKCRLHRSF